MRLSRTGLAYWHGEKVKRKPDGTTDRSATLYAVGGQLARGGTSWEGIVTALAERDIALGFSKYSGRRDRREYERIADKVLSDLSVHTLRPVPMAPMGRTT